MLWRDGSRGEGAHYVCQWAGADGGWRESDGLVDAGAVRRIPTPSRTTVARTGEFFPVIMLYETGV